MDLAELHEVRVGFRGEPILPPIDLSLWPGSFVGVVGPNGSGKTTLVRTILGLLPPVSGEVRYPRGQRPRFGYVPQGGAIDLSFPVTAAQIVLMGRFPRLGLGAWPRRRDHDAAQRALDEVGVGDLAGRRFHGLSGGQRQRVLLARALVGDPEVLVLDEPTTGMDLPAERGLLDQIASFAEHGIAVLMVSHQLAAVANYARRLCIIDRERQAVEVGAVEQVLTSARLSELYGHDVAVETIRGHTTVFLTGDTAPTPATGTGSRRGTEEGAS